MIDTQILQDYCNEARELLEEMDSNLLLIEREGANPELLNNIFREVHCIKGSAQYIGLERSSTLTHGLESLLDRLREGVIDAAVLAVDAEAAEAVSHAPEAEILGDDLPDEADEPGAAGIIEVDGEPRPGPFDERDVVGQGDPRGVR